MNERSRSLAERHPNSTRTDAGSNPAGSAIFRRVSSVDSDTPEPAEHSEAGRDMGHGSTHVNASAGVGAIPTSLFLELLA